MQLTCLPKGLPSQYNFQNWKQIFGEVEIAPNDQLRPVSTINLTSLNFQDSGNYSCSVDNSIPDRNDVLFQLATVEILVQGKCKLIQQ